MPSHQTWQGRTTAPPPSVGLRLDLTCYGLKDRAEVCGKGCVNIKNKNTNAAEATAAGSWQRGRSEP